METLLQGILNNPNIQSLEIVKNEIKHKAIERLSELFEYGRRQIKVLKLTDTKSGIEDAEILFEALSEYQHFSELKLNGFKISESAAQFLADTINNNTLL